MGIACRNLLIVAESEASASVNSWLGNSSTFLCRIPADSPVLMESNHNFQRGLQLQNTGKTACMNMIFFTQFYMKMLA